MGKCGKGKRVSWDFLFGYLYFKHGEKSKIGDFLFKQLSKFEGFLFGISLLWNQCSSASKRMHSLNEISGPLGFWKVSSRSWVGDLRGIGLPSFSDCWWFSRSKVGRLCGAIPGQPRLGALDSTPPPTRRGEGLAPPENLT